MPWKRAVPWLFVLLWYAWILFLSSEAATDSAARSGSILRWLSGLLGTDLTGGLLQNLVRKLAHGFNYGVLGALLGAAFWAMSGWRALWAWPFGIAMAAVDESFQRLVPGRSGELRDVAIDGLGVAVGLGLALLARWLRDRRKRSGRPGAVH